jgi:hypothetical protein
MHKTLVGKVGTFSIDHFSMIISHLRVPTCVDLVD